MVKMVLTIEIVSAPGCMTPLCFEKSEKRRLPQSIVISSIVWFQRFLVPDNNNILLRSSRRYPRTSSCDVPGRMQRLQRPPHQSFLVLVHVAESALEPNWDRNH